MGDLTFCAGAEFLELGDAADEVAFAGAEAGEAWS